MPTSRAITTRILALFYLNSFSLAQAAPFRVVLDPGHGGNDEGTVFEYGPLRIAEKDITLQLATEVHAQLEKLGFEVQLTRQADQDLPLPSRTALANQWQADAFISIHTNSAYGPAHQQAQGVETFILNNTSDASSKRLAHLENSVLSPSLAPNQLDKSLDVALILKDLRLDANLTESKRLACTVQGLLQTQPNTKDRGVKQSLFHVLLGADMPSILLEAGFLTHPKDRSTLLDRQGRKEMGSRIAHALDMFRNHKKLLSKCKVN